MTEKLSEILRGTDLGMGLTLKACQLLTLWSKVVDERVGRQTEPVKIRNRVLYISTSTPVWAQELSFLKSEIVERFNQAAGEEAIRDIKFSQGG